MTPLEPITKITCAVTSVVLHRIADALDNSQAEATNAPVWVQRVEVHVTNVDELAEAITSRRGWGRRHPHSPS